MAYFTKVKIKNIKKKIIEYNIRNSKIKGIKEGTTNSNYVINTKEKNYILTIIENNLSLKNIFNIIYFQNLLYYNNIKVPKFIKSNFGEYIFLIKNKYSLITTFLYGKKVENKYIKICYYLGLELSKIHNINYFNIQKNFMVTNNIVILYNKIKKKIPKKYFYFIDNEIKKDINYEKKILNKNIKYKNCHCDIFKDNVFIKNRKILGVFDFYYFSKENYLFDLAIFICEWCFKKKIYFRKFYYFLKGYMIKNNEILNFNYFLSYLRKISIRFMITRFINIKKKEYLTKNPYKYLRILIYINILKKNIILNLKKILYLCEKFHNKTS
ncbi:phosphotransferase [Candidatus Vidania fulgoroideorum]